MPGLLEGSEISPKKTATEVDFYDTIGYPA